MDAADAAFHLNERLGDRHCLIVIDDVWNQAHLDPFLKVGRNSAHLFTTRDLTLAAAARRVDVDAMTADQALAMLLAPLPERPADLAPFRDLAERMGQWPVLLDLAGRALVNEMRRPGVGVDAAAAYLARKFAAKGVVAFDDRNAVQRELAIARTVAVSLDFLAQDERENYLKLAVFPEDTDVPLSALSALWGIDAFDAEELVRRLADLSLVKPDMSSGTVRLHDVLRAYLLTAAKNATPLHAALVDGWGDPRRLPDGYAWRWIGYHMAGAGRVAEFRRLLFDFSWLRTKLHKTDVAALIAEFDFVGGDADVGLLQGAVRLSGHVLARDEGQLAGQLIGRLLSQPSSAIQALLDQARRGQSPPWLCPTQQALSKPVGPLLRTLAGHTSDVTAVAVTSDGRLAVSGSWDKTLKMWDLATGAEVRTLEGHANCVWAVAVTPDGKLAVSGSGDSTLKVWDLATGAEVRTRTGHLGKVSAVVVTPDGKLAVSGSSDTTLKV